MKKKGVYPALYLPLALSTAPPVILALGLFDFYEPGPLKLIISRLERLTALALIVLTIAILYKIIKGAAIRIAEPDEIGRKQKFLRIWGAPLLSSLPLLVYTFVFTLGAYRAFFLVSLDFTGISAAINSLSRGEGFLTTPFFHTGTMGSYFGHHFSPTLLIYTPFYVLGNLGNYIQEQFVPSWKFLRSTHLLYGHALFLTLVGGVIAWGALLKREVQDTSLRILIVPALLVAYPLWRLTLSFHYELPALIFFALTIIAYRDRNYKLLWPALFLLMGCKEDFPAYTFLLGVYLFLETYFQKEKVDPEEIRKERKTALGVALFSLIYFFAANVLMRYYFAGGEGPNWNYFQNLSDLSVDSLNPGPQFDMLAAFAFVPLLAPRLFIVCILPVFALHLFSGHAWHASFYGHYSYSVLPFLGLGYILGLENLRKFLEQKTRKPFILAAAVFSLALVFYSAAGEKETPLPAMKTHPDYHTVEDMLANLGGSSCLQTQTFFTAHAPLNIRVYPLVIHAGNPARKQFPPLLKNLLALPEHCQKYYLLIHRGYLKKIGAWAQNNPPYEHRTLDEFLEMANKEMKLLERRGDIYLYEAEISLQGEVKPASGGGNNRQNR